MYIVTDIFFFELQTNI